MNFITNTLLELEYFFIRESIGLSYDGDQVDFGMQSPHHFDVKLLQTGRCFSKGVVEKNIGGA